MRFRELIEFISQETTRRGYLIDPSIWSEIERAAMRAFPSEIVRIPKAQLSQKSAIAEAAKRLPTSVVAERFGVSRQWVQHIVKAGRR